MWQHHHRRPDVFNRRGFAMRTFGAPRGLPVLVLHGTPGAGSKFAQLGEMARPRNLRLIAPDRWGYGATPAPQMADLAAFATAAEALMEAAGGARYGVLGLSGGAPYAAALAARQPNRVAALALVSPVGEIAGHGGDLSWLHRLSFQVLPRLPGAIAVTFALLAGGLKMAPSTALRIAYARAAAADRATMADPDLSTATAAMFSEGLRSGTRGAVIDMVLFSRPWDVPLDAIGCPAKVWIGAADRNVPVARAVALAKSIRSCELDVIDGAGHLWSVGQGAVVLDWLGSALRG